MSATKWQCETCSSEGVLLYDDRAGVYEVINALEDAHREVKPGCLNSRLNFRVTEIAVKDIRAQSSGKGGA